MRVNLLTEHYLKFLSLNKGCTDSSESTLVKMPHGGSHVAAQLYHKQCMDRKIFLILFVLMNFMRGSRGGVGAGGLDPTPPGKSQQYRVY